LSVTAVYTTTSLDGKSISIDVEQITPRPITVPGRTPAGHTATDIDTLRNATDRAAPHTDHDGSPT
jgi:hypothetical protein